jgi:hypothetical protein
MVVYDEQHNRLEVVSLLEDRKRYISCVGIDPRTEKVLSADEFGNEIRVRVVPRVGPKVGTGIVRLVKYDLSQATLESGSTAPAPAAESFNPFASRDPKSRF